MSESLPTQNPPVNMPLRVRHPNIHASQLDEASDRIHELTTLLEFLRSCSKWETEQPLTAEGFERADDLQCKRLGAYDALNSLATSILLGPVCDAINSTAKALRREGN